MKYPLAIAALCIALAGISGCKKASDETPKDAPEVQANDTGSQDNAKPADETKPEDSAKPADETKPTAEAPKANDTPPDGDHGMAAARERAKLKFHTPICPEGATLEGDKCFCPAASGTNPDGKCDLKAEAVQESGKGFKCVPNFFECFQTVMCTLPEGCTSPDGRYYGPYYTHSLTAGGIVVSEETPYEAGECVLDRTDGLKLFSELGNDKSGDFACDQEFCACADTTCIRTELCLGGKCQPDTAKIPELTPSNRSDLEADSLPLYLDNMPPFVFDTYKCEGGKVYCHGKDNPPMVRPHGDFECQKVSSLPGFEGSLKAWVCPFDNACPCGSSKCKKDQICYNGACI